mgnify:CR=1 FL=1
MKGEDSTKELLSILGYEINDSKTQESPSLEDLEFEKTTLEDKEQQAKQLYQEYEEQLSNREEDIKIKDNKELKELIYLQKLFKMGRIIEKDLSKEERIGLEKLYKQQIYDLKKSINGYKNKILSIRVKIEQSN